MRILRQHNKRIEQDGRYTCMKCLINRHGNLYMDNSIGRVYDEVFSNCSGIGGYTILFTTDDGDILCAECAKQRFILDRVDVTCDTYDEGPTLYCDECNREIESSYGDPDNETEEI